MVHYFIKFPAVINAFIIKIALNLIQNLLHIYHFPLMLGNQILEGFPLKGMRLTFAPQPSFDFGSPKKQEVLVWWKFFINYFLVARITSQIRLVCFNGFSFALLVCWGVIFFIECSTDSQSFEVDTLYVCVYMYKHVSNMYVSHLHSPLRFPLL